MTDIALDEPLAALARPTALPARHVMAAVIGNALEFYDFGTYAYFAVYIGQVFFPFHGPAASLLLSLATFGAGFFTRPLGAIVIGTLGDRVGRKPAMMLTFWLMGIAILGLALTPSYASIGIAAPILVLVFRLLQGFALGGEFGPTTAFLVEAAPAHRRGLYGALQPASQQVAQVAAGVVGTVLALTLTGPELRDWGWRLAMLLGAAIIPFGLSVRRGLPETLDRPNVAMPAARTSARPYLPLIAFAAMMMVSATVSFYIITYLTTYALGTLHLSRSVSFGVIFVTGMVQAIFLVLSGFLSDRFGRKPVMLLSGAVLILSIVPAFWVIVHGSGVAAFYLPMAWLAMVRALNNAPIFVVLTESLPKPIRSGALAITYAVIIASFGGTAQFAVQWLLDLTKDPLVPAYYWTAAAAIGLIGMALVKEVGAEALAGIGMSPTLKAPITYPSL